jgi:Kef-type K+ transport system membrane component KefB
VIRAAILLAIVAGLTLSARSFLPEGVSGGGATMLAFGFLLLAALQTGHVFHELRLPHLTGFLLCGAVFGPELVGLLTKDMVADLAVIKRVAVGLIALQAGCELNLRALRPRLRLVSAVGVFGFVAAFALLWGFFFVAARHLPYGEGLTDLQRAIVAIVGANVTCALSPAVVIGIVSETRASGPVTELALSLVVLADLAIVVTFSLTESLAGTVFPLSSSGGVGSLFAHVLGSLAVGTAVGAALALFCTRIGRKVGLFVFGLLFVVAEAGGAYHIDPLLVGLAAGLFVENISTVSGHAVVQQTEPASLPTFAVFFATVGAEIHLHDFIAVAPWALGAALLRASGFFVGLRVAAARTHMEPLLWKNLYFGMLPQAGVAIALAILVRDKFGAWGEQLSVVIFGVIVVNELSGPILWRAALVRAGEVGRRDARPTPGHARRASTVSDLPAALGD